MWRYLKLLPLQGALLNAMIPRALPWARRGCPFRAQGDGEIPTWWAPHTPWFTFVPYAMVHVLPHTPWFTFCPHTPWFTFCPIRHGSRFAPYAMVHVLPHTSRFTFCPHTSWFMFCPHTSWFTFCPHTPWFMFCPIRHGLCFAPYALKGQKLLAQGSALG